ncbi:MAG: Clp protease N-terminal domain-containing protein [Patescibacteria group bacterium]
MKLDISDLTAHADKALVLARKEAQRLGSPAVSSAHLALGLIILSESAVGVVLKQAPGFDLDVFRSRLEAAVLEKGTGHKDPEPTYAPRIGKIIYAAREQAGFASSPQIDTGHLFLGIILQADSAAAKIIAELIPNRSLNEWRQLFRVPPQSGAEATVSVKPEDEYVREWKGILDLRPDVGPKALYKITIEVQVQAVKMLGSGDYNIRDNSILLQALDNMVQNSRNVDLLEGCAEVYRQLLGKDAFSHLRVIWLQQPKEGETAERGLAMVIHTLTGEFPKREPVAKEVLPPDSD